MKLRYLFVFLIITILLSITFVGIKHNDSEKEKLLVIDNAISMNQKQLRQHSGVILTSVASERDKGYFKVMINIDKHKIPFEEYEELINSYLSSVAEDVSPNDFPNDWKHVLKPYTFKFEKMSEDSNGTKVVVEKPADSTELIWKTKW